MSIRITAERSWGTREKSKRTLEKEIFAAAFLAVLNIMEKLGTITDLIEIVKLYPAQLRPAHTVAMRIVMRNSIIPDEGEKIETQEFYLDFSPFSDTKTTPNNAESQLYPIFVSMIMQILHQQLHQNKVRGDDLNERLLLLTGMSKE